MVMKIQAIINKNAGSGKALDAMFALKDAFGDNGLRIEETLYRGHAGQIAREAIADGCELIIAVGGDGTVNEIANAIIGSNVRLGIVPWGKANDLATQHGISCGPETAVKIIRAGHTRNIDCIRVNGYHYLTSGGIGLGTDVIKTVEGMLNGGKLSKWLVRILGNRIYSFGIIRMLLKKNIIRHAISLSNGHKNYDSCVLSLVVGNQPILAKYFRVLPSAENNDGKFDVCMIKADGSRFCVAFTILQTIRGRHKSSSSISQARADRLIIKSTQPLRFFADGEIIMQDKYFEIQIIPRSIKLLTPEENGDRS
jgi:YegS/Rv2252/BmrU family lipid kinase